MTERPSAFTDSPEDLIARAKQTVEEGSAPPKIALLLSDLARELSKSREGHAGRMAMATAAYAEKHAIEAERDDLRKEKKALEQSLASLRRYLRGASLASFVVLAVSVFALVESFRVHR